MWIPENLIRYRIMGKNRMERCECGHYHRGKGCNDKPTK